MTTQKRIAIYGSTGSIGTQTIDVVKAYPEHFSIEVLVANTNADLLIAQALDIVPNAVIIVDESKYEDVKKALSSKNIKVYAGANALIEVAATDMYDIMVSAIVGFAGLSSTLAAIQQSKTIALANKETLVVAGDIVMNEVKTHGATLIPVDSEHSAIFQCLMGEKWNEVEKITLTASGGPFLGKKTNYLINVKKEHALQHPNWTMGAKITIDSASLMNKGLEMIEAKWLFGLKNEQIEVIVHPQSIVHSFVHFVDGSVKAQMGLPDMKLPIQFALSYPHRLLNKNKHYEIKNFPSLTFEQADIKTFRNLELAKNALYKGGNAPCILNAANEVVVEAFIKNKVGFLEMSDIIEKCMDAIPFIEKPTLHDYITCDAETREYTKTFYKP
ncbi:MAG: 1-deoxy-D-xylulose-5-phosphate reductoisomerase [Chitinophagaceae bacterium]